MLVDRIPKQSRVRFSEDTISNLSLRIEDMESRMIESSWLERLGRAVPDRKLNKALMTARVIYARRTRDFEEAERLDGTLTGIEERMTREEKVGWES